MRKSRIIVGLTTLVLSGCVAPKEYPEPAEKKYHTYTDHSGVTRSIEMRWDSKKGKHYIDFGQGVTIKDYRK